MCQITLFLYIQMISTLTIRAFLIQPLRCHNFQPERIRNTSVVNHLFYSDLHGNMKTRSGLDYRLSSTSSTSSSDSGSEDDDDKKIITIEFPLKLPKSLSPSAAMAFKQCPQSYLFQYILGIKQPTTEALAKGSMCHTALEKLFDLPAKERTLEALQNLMRQAWKEARYREPYSQLFRKSSDTDERDVAAERKWGTEALNLLTNYVNVEDPKRVQPEPLQREMWVKANLALDPSKGVTYHSDHTATNDKRTDETFFVRGIVDRIDLVDDPIYDGCSGLRIVDYKTGKAPNFKYSKAMNNKIADEAMWQLKVYALLLREMFAKNRGNDFPDNANLCSLRLLYLTSVSGKGQFLDLDLGETEEKRDAVLNEIHRELSEIWGNITDLVNKQDPREFVGCDRKFCYCHKLRHSFVNGTVWRK